ncbi:MAG TPA: hypothetical protein V6C57_14645 [Coleofasciculaceae cyanobacterium]
MATWIRQEIMDDDPWDEGSCDEDAGLTSAEAMQAGQPLEPEAVEGSDRPSRSSTED